MSLINQVLRDLDRRQAGVEAASIAALDLRAARPARPTPRWIFAVGIAGAGAALALALTFGAALARSRQAEEAASPPSGEASAAIVTTRLTTIAVPAAAVEPAPSLIDPSRPQSRAPMPAALAAATTGSTAAPLPAPSAAPIAVPSAATPATEPSAIPSLQQPIIAQPPDRFAAVADPAPSVRALAASAPDPGAALPARLDKRAPAPGPTERAEAAYRSGVDAHREGRNDAAEAAFAHALQEDARHAAARQALAVLLVGRGRSGTAETLLADGLALDARQPLLATTLARIQAGRGDLAGAIALLEPQEGAQAQALIATLLQSAGRHAEATEHYVLALQLAPANGAWWAAMSVSLAALGRHENARGALLRARDGEQVAPELLLWIDQRLRAGTSARGFAAAN